MTQTSTVAEYRNLYANKYGVQFPLSDAKVMEAIEQVTEPTVYPFDPRVVEIMKSSADAEVGS